MIKAGREPEQPNSMRDRPKAGWKPSNYPRLPAPPSNPSGEMTIFTQCTGYQLKDGATLGL